MIDSHISRHHANQFKNAYRIFSVITVFSHFSLKSSSEGCKFRFNIGDIQSKDSVDLTHRGLNLLNN